MIEIFWHGNSSVAINTRNTKIAFNPKDTTQYNLLIYDKPQDKIKTEEGQFKIDSPGEYEINQAMVYAILDENGKVGSWQLVVDDISFYYCHDLQFLPTEEQLDDMGTIDVAFVPVATDKDAEKHAVKLAEAIEPRIIIPIAADDTTDSKVCLDLAKTLGLKCEAAAKSFKIKDRKNLPEDQQLYIALEKS